MISYNCPSRTHDCQYQERRKSTLCPCVARQTIQLWKNCIAIRKIWLHDYMYSVCLDKHKPARTCISCLVGCRFNSRLRLAKLTINKKKYNRSRPDLCIHGVFGFHHFCPHFFVPTFGWSFRWSDLRHCASGISRSVAVCTAWIMLRQVGDIVGHSWAQEGHQWISKPLKSKTNIICVDSILWLDAMFWIIFYFIHYVYGIV